MVFRLPLFLIEQKMIIFEVRAKPKNAENNYGALTYCEYLECFIVVWTGNDLASDRRQLLQYYVIRTIAYVIFTFRGAFPWR